MDLVALVVPTLPGFFWLFIFYRTDRYQPEPKGLVIQTFLLGIASLVPTIALYEVAQSLYDHNRVTGLAMRQLRVPSEDLAIVCFFVIGPVEELCKFLAVRVWAYRRPAFDEPPDGIVYAAAAALGFAAVENITYVSASGSIDEKLLIMRSLLSLPAHVMFAVCWGTGLSIARMRGGAAGFLAQVVGLACAAALHGTYDYLALRLSLNWALLPLMIMMTYMTWVSIRLLRRASQFAPGKPLAGRGREPAVAPAQLPAVAPPPALGFPGLPGPGVVPGVALGVVPAPAPAPPAMAPALERRYSYPPWLPGGYAPPSEAPICKRCGSRGVSSDDRFCGRCGTPFVARAA